MILIHESFGWNRDIVNCSPESLLLDWGAGRDVVEAMLLFERFFGGWIVFTLEWSRLWDAPTVKIAEVGGRRSAWDESVKMTTEGLAFETCWWTLESGNVDMSLRNMLLSLGKGFDTWRWYGAEPNLTRFIFVDGMSRDSVKWDISRFGATWEHVVEVPRYGSLEEMKMKFMLKGVS